MPGESWQRCSWTQPEPRWQPCLVQIQASIPFWTNFSCHCACLLHSSLDVAPSTASSMACRRQQRAARCALCEIALLAGRTACAGMQCARPRSSSPLNSRARFVWLAALSLFCRRDCVHLLRHRERQLGHLGGCDGSCRPCSEDQNWPAAPHCVQARGSALSFCGHNLGLIFLPQQGLGVCQALASALNKHDLQSCCSQAQSCRLALNTADNSHCFKMCLQ